MLIAPASTSLAADLFVSNEDPTCAGESPCFTSIQQAIDGAQSGDRVRIQPGLYRERLRVVDKNAFPGAGESQRIVIGRAEDAEPDSVILSPDGGGCADAAIDIARSSHVTISGLVITGSRGPALRLRGGPRENLAIHVERNRIFDNGGGECSGGIVIEKGNPGTLVVNNLIYANAGHGIELAAGPARGRGQPPWVKDKGRRTRRGQGLEDGGPHFLVQNTIHGNAGNGIAIAQRQESTLVNNAVTGNGVTNGALGGSRRAPRGWPVGYGVVRDESRYPREEGIELLNNLLCGNALAEVHGPVFVGDHADNLTPTGLEAAGVIASPECVPPDGVYESLAGTDGVAGTLDDDFALTGPGAQGMPSPALDRGADPRDLLLDPAFDPLFLADFSALDVRPIQGDINRPLDFDIGALERLCDCFENCEECEIVLNPDGTSANRCSLTYDPSSQCCDRTTGGVSERHLGEAFDVCPESRTANPDFNPQGSADGCSAVPDHPLPLCPSVRFGCDEDSGEENCPEGIDLPCNQHDFCYQTCGPSRDECDLEFRNNMIEVCDAMTLAQKALCYDDCLIAAAAYFDGVVVAGGEAYVNGQNRGCQCCQNVFPPPDQP